MSRGRRHRSHALLVCLLGIGGYAVQVSAHHSSVEYDAETFVEARGEVVRVLWRNPHVRLEIRVDGTADGTAGVWGLEGMDVTRLDRAGIPRDVIQVGDVVTFAGNPSTRRERRMYVTNVLLAGGTEILLRSNAEPRWQADRVLSFRDTSVDSRIAAADRSQDIFRAWIPTGGQTPDWADDPPLTEAARAAREGYDAVLDDPVLGCTPPGMPRVITRSGGYAIRFEAVGDDIVLRNEWFALDRVIRMGVEEDVAPRAPRPLGHSTGRWENGSLVVTTTRIDWPFFQLYGLEGVPQSPEMEIVERFTLSAEGDELPYDLSATDPNTFTETVTAARYTVFSRAPGLELLPYECVLDE